jgi:hypothetical protein
MRLRVLGVCLLGIALSSAAAAATHVVVQPRVPPPDNVTQPALLTFMKTVRNPTIVLRVPAPQTLVTQAQGQQGSADLGEGYLTIEKELVKAGFTVRDRGLLVEILRSNQNLDYGVIQQKIDAQLILEIVSIQRRSYGNDVYVEANRHREGRLRRGEFPISGWHFESRIIMVSSGEIGGIYTVDVAPEGLHFLVSGSDTFNATPQGKRDREHVGYGVGSAQDAAPEFVRMLVSSLIPTAERASIGVRILPMTSDAIRGLGFRIPKNAKGVLIAGVSPNSRAAASGVYLGDVIEQVDGRTVQSPQDVANAVNGAGGGAITLAINRGGRKISINVPAAGR